MKKIISSIVLSVVLFAGCESDDAAENLDSQEPGFNLTIEENGQKRSFSGTGAVFTSSFTPGVTFEGEDTELNSIVIIVQDPTNGEDLTLGITMEKRVREGSHPIGTDIATFYNAFANYSKEAINNSLPKFLQSKSGNIRLSGISASRVSGSVDLRLAGEDGEMAIKGSFVALKP